MIAPFLVFAGQARAALAFYADALRALPSDVFAYGDYVPEGLDRVPEGLSDWVLHAELRAYGATIWISDEVLAPVTVGTSVKLALSIPTADEARMVFSSLSQGGRVTLPPTEAFYSAFHAALVDRFGVSWNVVAEEPPAKS